MCGWGGSVSHAPCMCFMPVAGHLSLSLGGRYWPTWCTHPHLLCFQRVHPFPSELEEAVLRALKRARGSSIALSRVGSIEWQHIQTASQLEVVAQELLGMELPAEAVSDLIPLFQWSGEAERQQSER